MMDWCEVWIQSLDHAEEPLSRRLGYAERERVFGAGTLERLAYCLFWMAGWKPNRLSLFMVMWGWLAE
ncbi:hypothetical protein YC2023_076056 [Brassica napus]